ncbi:MAG: hypothetical protein RLZZ175_1949 [Bacteroidota bacterium]|jgi:hypothetical protein
MPNKMNRTSFLKLLAAGTSAISLGYFFTSLKNQKSEFTIALKHSFPNYKLGHKLWKTLILPNNETFKTKTVIIGAGISGLSAAYFLEKQHSEYIILELEKNAGGNARFEQNAVGKYPLGAHYLPIPGLHQQELIDFLSEIEVITGFKNNVPIYNEEYLCQAPEDRLLINGRWQDGLIPHFGLDKNEIAEIEAFLQFAKKLQFQKGNDGKYAFDLPMQNSSSDEAFLKYDAIALHAFLLENNWKSNALHWYLDYCCKDDFGIGIDEISAWVALHYFAGRKGKAANAESSEVLTWQNGNGFLMEKLLEKVKRNLKSQSLVYAVNKVNNQFVVKYFDDTTQQCNSIICESVIFACPQFVLKHLQTNVHELIARQKLDIDYTSWLVATCKVKNELLSTGGYGLAWDNVKFGAPNLGYVVSNHQEIALEKPFLNLTFYKVFDEKVTRKFLLKQNTAYFKDIVVNEMKAYHTNFEEVCTDIHTHIWAHAISKPKVNTIKTLRDLQSENSNSKIQFAHSDWGGMSVFEEAFYQGLYAARKLI